MSNKYTEEQIQAMIKRIKQIKPEEATRDRAIKILDSLPHAAKDITNALNQMIKESKKKLPIN